MYYKKMAHEPGSYIVTQHERSGVSGSKGELERDTTIKQKTPGSCRGSSILAEATGFEPAISALTGLHVRPLHHASSPSSLPTSPSHRQAET